MDRVLLANRARHDARLVQLKVSEDLRVTVGGADQDGVGDLRPTERLPFDNLLPGTQLFFLVRFLQGLGVGHLPVPFGGGGGGALSGSVLSPPLLSLQSGLGGHAAHRQQSGQAVCLCGRAQH